MHTIFVGDLSGEVTDKTLRKAFSPFGEVTDARVMMDSTTGRSRGFGFVSYRTRAEAEQAMGQMNGFDFFFSFPSSFLPQIRIANVPSSSSNKIFIR